MDSDKSIFVYSLSWVESVFSSKEVAENLLSVERESGNLTSADYEKASDFLPRAKFYSYHPVRIFVYGTFILSSSTQLGGLVLCTLAAAFGIQHRKPGWANLQKASVVVSFGIAGYAIGKFNMLKVHARFLSSIDNPQGFVEAIRNIESRTGLHNQLTRGPKFTSIWADNMREKISFERRGTLSSCVKM